MSTTPLGNLQFSLSCQKCGSNELTIPDEATDDSMVTCSACGSELARWGDVRTTLLEAATQVVKESVSDSFGKEFDGLDGVTFKNAE